MTGASRLGLVLATKRGAYLHPLALALRSSLALVVEWQTREVVWTFLFKAHPHSLLPQGMQVRALSRVPKSFHVAFENATLDASATTTRAGERPAARSAASTEAAILCAST